MDGLITRRNSHTGTTMYCNTFSDRKLVCVCIYVYIYVKQILFICNLVNYFRRLRLQTTVVVISTRLHTNACRYIHALAQNVCRYIHTLANKHVPLYPHACLPNITVLNITTNYIPTVSHIFRTFLDSNVYKCAFNVKLCPITDNTKQVLCHCIDLSSEA
jgi:hypothetical protein